MHDPTLASALEMTVLASTAAALAVAVYATGDRARATTNELGSRFSLRALFLHPLAQLLLVCGVLYLNQVLFGAYILRAHGGSTAFISRFIPGPWFAIGTHDPFVRLAAAHVGDGRWLSPTLLRVQAFLELPFTMFAYLAVARLLGRRLYGRLCRLPVLALAALSFSVTFSLVELALTNPFTRDDLVLRALSCLVTPMYIAWIARREERRSPVTAPPPGPAGALGLLAFLAGAGAIAYIVLALYDAFLLYNLAHLPRYASGIASSVVIAAVASFAAPRIDAVLAKATGQKKVSVAMDCCVSALRAFTLLFFVPSLAIRYWGGHPSAVLSGLLVVVLGFVLGVREALRRDDAGAGTVVRLAASAAVALLFGGWAAHLAVASASHGAIPELLLARAALSFLAVAIVAFRAVEIFVCWPEHETKAQADEA